MFVLFLILSARYYMLEGLISNDNLFYTAHLISSNGYSIDQRRDATEAVET